MKLAAFARSGEKYIKSNEKNTVANHDGKENQ